MIKKILLVLSMIILMFVMSACANKPKTNENGEHIEDVQAIIAWGSNGYEHIQVEHYTRISQNWIEVESTDGRIFYTNERNVLIIQKKIKE